MHFSPAVFYWRGSDLTRILQKKSDRRRRGQRNGGHMLGGDHGCSECLTLEFQLVRKGHEGSQRQCKGSGFNDM